jgi:predicted amidohydrolase
MTVWKIAAVQMDCRRADRDANLAAIRAHLKTAAGEGARLVVFPECALTGYCFDSLAEVRPLAEPVPGPTIEVLTRDCREFRVYAVVGMLEASGEHVHNVAVLVGPEGLIACYRKVHLPFLGVDRFTTPGNRPFAVHAIDGLRVGMSICYDGSFPETARCLMLAGADLVVLPTNWPTGAVKSAQILVPARALENHIYYCAVNRVGTECGFRFIGRSRIVSPFGETLAAIDDDSPGILYANVDPAIARAKHLVNIPGAYELHRVRDRRPSLYEPLVRPASQE